ncbi:MAG: hypothetical protein AB2L14_01710 [Candidatus Xenobiia bacterium LiM19]
MNNGINFRETESIYEKGLDNMVISGGTEEMFLDNLMSCIGCI